MKSKTRIKRERMMRQMDADMEEFFNYNDRGHEQDKINTSSALSKMER